MASELSFWKIFPLWQRTGFKHFWALFISIYIFWNAWAIVSHWYPMFEPSTCQELCQNLPTKPMWWISTEHGNILPIGMALFPAKCWRFHSGFLTSRPKRGISRREPQQRQDPLGKSSARPQSLGSSFVCMASLHENPVDTKFVSWSSLIRPSLAHKLGKPTIKWHIIVCLSI